MAGDIPSFFVYGEPVRQLDVGFTHIETVMERKQVHMGRVEAHKHDTMAQITFWLRGHGRYFIEDRSYDFSAPAVSFVPSGVVHGFTVEPEESDAIVASIADTALPPIGALCALPLQQTLMVMSDGHSEAWQRLSETMQRLHADYRAGTFETLAALLCVALNDIALLARRKPNVHGSAEADLAAAFRTLVDSRFRENWAIGRYVEELATTPHLLTKAVRKAFARTPKALIEERRLIEAKRLLLFTVRSAEDIGYETGFHDPAYFSRFFRQKTGLPPGLWRERHDQASEVSGSPSLPS
jgi:AraC family transcriptional activator of pobA